MKAVKTIECEDGFANPTGTYFGVPAKHEQQLMIGDFALLQCKGVTVLVKVAHIDGIDITGTIDTFEDTDDDSIGGIALGDNVLFQRHKLRGWQRA